MGRNREPGGEGMGHKNQTLENVLMSVVLSHELSEQSEILEKLRQHHIEIGQATLSRWLKKLQIVKVNNRYQMLNQNLLTRLPIISVKISLPNLMVLHTLPGNANALAYQIDQKMTNNSHADDSQQNYYEGVLGTIAGDDTVLVIMQDELHLKQFKQYLEKTTDEFFILLSASS